MRRGARPALVSVVVPCFNSADTLGEQLKALAAQDYEGSWEVVLADNGSTDGSVELAQSWAPKLRALTVVHVTDHGVSNVRNCGARAANGDLLAFCDSDDVVVPGWLTALVAAAADADIVGGRLDDVSLNDPHLVFWRGALPDAPLERFGHLPYAPGGNCAVWRDVFEDLRGWDPGYVAGSDDADFSWRAQARGYTVTYAREAVLRYRYRGTLRGVCKQFFRYGLTEVRLYRAFRPDLPRFTWRDLAETWRELFRQAKRARGRDAWGRWLRDVSYHLGHLRGSLHERVLVP